MYIPKQMAMTGQNTISDFISSHNFGVLISSDLNATHLPFVFAANEGEKGVLYGHVAKANSHWRTLHNERVLIVFNGPHSYISPTWYHQQPAVPTWNYAAVHCYGTVQLLGDADTQDAMQALITQHEASLLTNKALMPDDYQQKLRQAIVAFKVVVDDIQAKEKLGQHRKAGDQQGTYHALRESHNRDSNELSDYMEKRNLGLGHSQ
ncbi:FMN-binding negative transcriptional regulator [Celerinatantimonas yamalensis]|uniref:FMN-binding negative transcriptional regulator n=1 Tax=Celerinatantimonas yamalensis TaxID=559956 RepID=A0ABW9GAD3_9GAMM